MSHCHTFKTAQSQVDSQQGSSAVHTWRRPWTAKVASPRFTPQQFAPPSVAKPAPLQTAPQPIARPAPPQIAPSPKAKPTRPRAVSYRPAWKTTPAFPRRSTRTHHPLLFTLSVLLRRRHKLPRPAKRPLVSNTATSPTS